MNRRTVVIIAVIVLGLVGMSILTPNGTGADGTRSTMSMSESELYRALRDKPESVQRLVFEGQSVLVYRSADSYTEVTVPDEASRAELKKVANEKNVNYDSNPEPKPSMMLSLLFSLLPMILMVALFIFFFRMMKNGAAGGQAGTFAKHKGRKFEPANGRITFSDVKGQTEAKEELGEVVQFLRDAGSFKEVGAKIPRGVLLIGPPGTGKTLLARAVAGEAGVPFYSISGSEFVEMFVGVGAARVRDLFEEVKRNAPAIVFIDELDGVGRQRGAGLGGSNDEREQTLNQILVEMDGFDQSGPPVIVIAATNRPDVLDPALLRPGRFSRQVTVERPDNDGRLATLEHYLKGKPVEEGLDLDFFARATQGMSQADIANICNEAALFAARRKSQGVLAGILRRADKALITADDLDKAISKQQFGAERTSMRLDEDHRINVGVHEAGHAVAHWKMSGGDMPRKITIVPTTRAAGYVQLLLKANQMTQTYEECFGFLVMALAGRTAQVKLLNRSDTGASNDFQQAWNLARRMVAEWGWSDLGVIHAPLGEEHPFLGRSIGEAPHVSQRLMEQIEDETQKLIKKAQEQADAIIDEYKDAILHVKDILLERETILGPEFVAVMEGQR
jgi:cell division protease FtsH